MTTHPRDPFVPVQENNLWQLVHSVHITTDRLRILTMIPRSTSYFSEKEKMEDATPRAMADVTVTHDNIESVMRFLARETYGDIDLLSIASTAGQPLRHHEVVERILDDPDHEWKVFVDLHRPRVGMVTFTSFGTVIVNRYDDDDKFVLSYDHEIGDAAVRLLVDGDPEALEYLLSRKPTKVAKPDTVGA